MNTTPRLLEMLLFAGVNMGVAGIATPSDLALATAANPAKTPVLLHGVHRIAFLRDSVSLAGDNITEVRVLVESSQVELRPVGSFVLNPLPVVHLDAGASALLDH